MNHYKETAPYGHGDWALDNIMVDGDNFQFIDWDKCDIYTEQEVFQYIYREIFVENIKKRSLYK